MINFRYHVVSLTAVFLALVIGVVMGSTVISKATVDVLRSNVRRAEAGIGKTNATNRTLSGQLSQYQKENSELTDQLLAQSVRDSLSDVPVLLIASKGIDGGSLDDARAALLAAGARFDGTLLVNDRLALSTSSTNRLADLLGVEPSDDVMGVLVERLAAVLTKVAGPAAGAGSSASTSTSTSTTARRPRSTTTLPLATPNGVTTSLPRTTTSTTTTIAPASGVSEPELVTKLRQAGFLDFRPPEGGSSSDLVLTTEGYDYVVVSGPSPSVPNEDFLDPLMRALATGGGAPVVAASAAVGDNAEADRAAFVGPLRSDATLSGRISTVDDLERFPGLVALVFALRELPIRHGQYGIGKGADALLPVLSP